jgi:CRISPR-associated protein Cas2
MRYLVTYDIASQRVRYRVAKCLLGYGDRVQKSVFECRLREGQAKEMARRLGLIAIEEGDSIRIYAWDERHEGSLRVIGRETARPEADWFLV